MSYSAGACLHAFALFACESHGLSYIFCSANKSIIGATVTTGQITTTANGIPGHQNTTGTLIYKEYSQSLLLAV